MAGSRPYSRLATLATCDASDNFVCCNGWLPGVHSCFMSPLHLRGSYLFWVIAPTLFASNVGSVELAPPNSQNEYVVERIAAVPRMTIRTMVQTRDGYLWMGGYKGLG